MTIGDLISTLFEVFEHLYGCPHRAAIATAEVVNRVLMARERARKGDLEAIPAA